jgi:hypothetical protein
MRQVRQNDDTLCGGVSRAIWQRQGCLQADPALPLPAHKAIFAPPGTQAEDAVVHRLTFAKKPVKSRAASEQISTQQHARLEAVRVYRGAPRNHYDRRLCSIAQVSMLSGRMTRGRA